MSYRIEVTGPAEKDIDDIIEWIRVNDSVASVRYVYDKIESAIFSLKELPFRGRECAELAELDLPGYREIRFKPYRIFYDVQNETVHVRLIVDGRRNLEDILGDRMRI